MLQFRWRLYRDPTDIAIIIIESKMEIEITRRLLQIYT